MRSVAVYLTFILLLTPSLYANKYAPKLTIATGFGVLTNEGLNHGSTTSMGGLNIRYDYFLSQVFSYLIGYAAQFDMKNGSESVSGFSLGFKYYYYNIGTRAVLDTDKIDITLFSALSFYAGSTYGFRKYFLGDDPIGDENDKLEGEYSNINLILGSDYKLNARYSLNAQLDKSLFTFSKSDTRYRLSDTVLWLGVCYVF